MEGVEEEVVEEIEVEENKEKGEAQMWKLSERERQREKVMANAKS